MPYLKDHRIPIIFSGLDWDISVYDAPYKNTTSIISIELAEQLIVHLKKYSVGDRIAWLGGKTLTSEKIVNAYKNVLNIEFTPFYVKDFSEWKTRYNQIQKSFDILILNGSIINLHQWDPESAKQFIMENTKIPTGTVGNTLGAFALIELSRYGLEIGEWIGGNLIRLLQGKDISDIPVSYTKEGDLLLNLDLAEIMEIEFEPMMLKNAEVYSDKE